jgi:hypothetical protein
MSFVWLRDCDRVGARTSTFFRPRIENAGRIIIGANVRLNSNWAPIELVTGPDGTIEIGDDTYVNYGTLVSSQSVVRIGPRVMIGNYSIIGDSEVPPFGGVAVPVFDVRPIEIGAGAWLAARVTVLPGARIGARAVIAAGSVVAGEIPDDAVAGGIPARVLKMSARSPDAAAEDR